MFRPYKVIHSPPRRQIQELFMFHHIVGSQMLLGGPEDNLIRSKHVALAKYTIFVYK